MCIMNFLVNFIYNITNHSRATTVQVLKKEHNIGIPEAQH